MTKVRRLMVAAMAACLVMGIAAAPSAMAAKKHKSKGPSAAAFNKLKKQVAADRVQLGTLTKNLGSALASLKSTDDKVNGVLTAAPQIVDNLTKLGAVVKDQIGPGLTTVADTLKNTIGPGLTTLGDTVKNTIGPGLTKVAANLGADEYGIVQFTVPDNANTNPDDADNFPDPILGCFYETGNIPDNVQSAIVSGQCLVPAGTDAASALNAFAAIRSNESDGKAGNADPTKATGGAGLVALDIRDTSGTRTGAGATIPAGAGQPPLKMILVGSPPTSTTETSFPFGPISSDLPNLVDLTAGAQYQGAPAPPTVNPGDLINFTARFVDLTSAKDDPTE